MSLPIPLAVRLSNSRGDIHVTRQVRDLSMRWTDPGGYSACRILLDRPLSTQPDEIAYYGTVTVYDARSGAVAWEGRLEDPGRSAGDQGQVWDLTAVGGLAHTRDRIVPLVYVDQPLSGLERVDNVTPGGTDSVGTNPGDSAAQDQALILQFPQGLTIATGARVVMRYLGLQRSGQKLARYDYTWDAGRTDAVFHVEAVSRTDGGSGETSRSATWNVAGGGNSPRLIVTNFPSGRNTVEWRISYTGVGGTVSDDLHWVAFFSPVVQATRYTAAGTEKLTAADYPNNYLFAHDVVADLLGRLLTAYDGAGARIDTTTHQIDKLAYPDGVDPARVLEDLMALESGFTWRVWERNSAGKYRFEWVAVPSAVRYEADLRYDTYEAPGSADGLYNRVTVRWRSSTGATLTLTRSASVPLLDSAGLIRQGQIDLGGEVGSASAAARAGDQWLAARRYPPNQGRLRIARPILDLQSGRMVQPWEIGPGLIRVRGVLPRPDALNATSRDGVTVMRVVSSEFRASDAAAMLDLDSPAPTTPQLIAEVRRVASRVRR